jgi:hypothetical protein
MIGILLLTLQGCSLLVKSQEAVNSIEVPRNIEPLDLHRTLLDDLPKYNTYDKEAMQVDLRSFDLTNLKLNDRLDDLIYADFDTRTKWPYWLPEGYDPKKIMAYGKNPGLGIESLHQQGITGENIGIAIIGDVLLPEHTEYRHALVRYEEISVVNKEASVSGSQLASLTVGKTAGIAPDARLYYFAETHLTDAAQFSYSGKYYHDQVLLYEPLVAALNEIVELNETLDVPNKIRVICIGQTIPTDSQALYYVEESIKKAQDQGIFVVSSLLYETSDYTMDFNGLGRDPLADPDELSSYTPAISYSHDFYTFGRYTHAKEGLLVPMDSKCTAAPTGKNDYAFYRQNNKSMGLAYITGMYALACQVNPEITPSIFWESALKTGDALTFTKKSNTFELKKIINPVRLIEAVAP